MEAYQGHSYYQEPKRVRNALTYQQGYHQSPSPSTPHRRHGSQHLVPAPPAPPISKPALKCSTLSYTDHSKCLRQSSKTQQPVQVTTTYTDPHPTTEQEPHHPQSSLRTQPSLFAPTVTRPRIMSSSSTSSSDQELGSESSEESPSNLLTTNLRCYRQSSSISFRGFHFLFRGDIQNG